MIDPIDEAIKAFFRRLLWAQDPIPVVYAGPDRAHGEIRRWLSKKENIPLDKAKNLNIPYPFCSVFVEWPAFDPTRFSPHRVRGVEMDVESGVAKSMKFPKPLVSGVQADFWCRSIRQAEVINAQLLLKFHDDETLLHVDWSDSRWYSGKGGLPPHLKILGHTKFWLKMTSPLSDNSDLETKGKDKEIRMTFSGEARFYMAHVPYLHKIAKRFEAEIIDDTDARAPVPLDTIDVPLGD
jgi:hypothetical protein